MMTSRRTLMMTGAMLAAAPVGRALAQPAAAEAAQVRARLAGFLQRLHDLSAAAPPPGANAANGHFITWVHGADLELGNMLNAQPRMATEEGAFLQDRFVRFGTMVRAGFAPGLHSSSFWLNWDVAGPTLEASLDGISRMVEGVFAGQASLGKIRSDLQAIGASLRGKLVTSGNHGNGWISVALRDGSNAFLAQMHDGGPVATPDGARVVQVMRSTAQAFAALPTNDHRPWLTGAWQAGFQAICGGSAAMLRG